MTTDAISRVGSTMSGCTRTRLIEKVGTRLTIMTATNTRTTALSGQLRDQPPVDEGEHHRRQRQGRPRPGPGCR